MGKDEDINSAVAHIVLCCVAGRGISRISDKSFTDPGMHANFFIHGVLGFLQHQSKIDGDVAPAYKISLKASRYLALPCLMADLYRSEKELSSLHLLSGVIPFILAITGKDDEAIGNLLLALNVASLCRYSMNTSKEWGWYTAGGAVFAYFCAPQMGPKLFYPLGLAVMEYCAYRVFTAHFYPPPPPGKR